MRKIAPNTPGYRLRALRKSLRLTQTAFAAPLGVSQDTISRAERADPIDSLLLIAICCVHGVNRAWLEQGEGPMFAPEADAEEAGYSRVPLVSVRLAAGAGAEVYHEGVVDALMFKTSWLHRDLRANLSSLVAMLVEGESMEPTLDEGDVVLVDRSQTDPTREGIYAVREHNMLLIKRLKNAGGGRILLISDNPAYPERVFPWPAPIHSMAVIGRVLWAGKRF